MEKNNHHPKSNRRDFKQIIQQDGIAIHGFGAFGKAISSILLRKIAKLGLKEGEITVLVRESLSDILAQTVDKSFQIALKERYSVEEILKLFFLKEQAKFIEENRKIMKEVLHPSKNIKFVSEKDSPEDYQAAINGNKYHFLAIPSSQIENKMDQIRSLSEDDLVFIDLAKGEHTIKDAYKDRTVHVSGPNFASEIVSEKPSGADVGSVNQELISDVMKILYADNFRPYEQKDVKAVLEGGIWKNVLAFTAGFLTENSDHKEKAQIIASLFIKMLEWGEKNGIERKDLLGLAGLGDFYLCMNPKSRNFEAGKELNNCLLQSENFDSLRAQIKENIAKRRGETEVTIESLETLRKYFKNPSFQEDPLIKGFYELANNDLTPAEILEIKQEMKDSLGRIKNTKIEKADLKFIKLIGHGVKMLTTKFGLRGNTESLLLARSIPEIFSSLSVEFDKIDNDELYIILENLFEIAFSYSYISEERLKKILTNFPEEKINDVTRPILKTILSVVKNNFDKKIIDDLVKNLMNRPIRISE